jgi:hypothetical protein
MEERILMILSTPWVAFGSILRLQQQQQQHQQQPSFSFCAKSFPGLFIGKWNKNLKGFSASFSTPSSQFQF